MDKALSSEERLKERRRKKNEKRKHARLKELGAGTGIFKKGLYKIVKTQSKTTVNKNIKRAKKNGLVSASVSSQPDSQNVIEGNVLEIIEDLDDQVTHTEASFDNTDVIRLSTINEQLAEPANQHEQIGSFDYPQENNWHQKIIDNLKDWDSAKDPFFRSFICSKAFQKKWC